MGQTRPYRLASAAFLSTTEIFALWSFPNPHNPETGSLQVMLLDKNKLKPI